MKRTFLSFCLGVSVAVSFPINAVGQIDINWTSLVPGTRAQALEPELHMRFDSIHTGSIVDSTTDPTNPFENLSQSLYVLSESADAPRFEAFVRAFPESAARQGSFSIQFRIVSGSLTLEVGHTSELWGPGERASYGMASNYFGVLFDPGSEIQIRGIPVQTASVIALEANVNYTFTVKWNFEDTGPVYTFFLNGERINSLSGTPFARIPEAAEADAGVTGFRILLGTRETAEGAVFIGQIQSASGPPVDLHE